MKVIQIDHWGLFWFGLIIGITMIILGFFDSPILFIGGAGNIIIAFLHLACAAKNDEDEP